VIRSLDGVEELTSLSVLDVPRNQITDLAPVASLARLGTLTLTANTVRDSPATSRCWPGCRAWTPSGCRATASSNPPRWGRSRRC
jgi:Leucine-rich repeat (LRR) protein